MPTTSLRSTINGPIVVYLFVLVYYLSQKIPIHISRKENAMIWEGKGYFSWPGWCDTVYEVSLNAFDPASITVLPDGTELMLVLKDDWIEVEKTSSQDRPKATLIQAKKMFDARNDPPRQFTGDWEEHLRWLNIAAATNVVLFVQVPLEEYERLRANDEKELEALKGRLSERAASLLYLFDFGEGEKFVQMCHTGSCP